MQSRITIEVDYGNGNQPVIQIIKRESDDVRDNLLKAFLESFSHISNFCTIEWMENRVVDNKTEFHRIFIRPVKPEELLQYSRIMEKAARLSGEDPGIDVRDNSDGFRMFLNSINMRFNPNGSCTTIFPENGEIDLFYLGIKFEQYKQSQIK